MADPSHRYTAKQTSRILRIAAVFIIPFEGFSARPYQDTAGVWTIGYGHIEHVNSSGVTIDGKFFAKLSRLQALRLLQADLRHIYWPAVRDFPVKLNLFQAAATVSFVYNCGVGMLADFHDFGRLLRLREFKAAAQSLLEYVHDIKGHALAGLVRRRRAEKALFEKRPTAVVHTIIGRVVPKGRKRGRGGGAPQKTLVRNFQRAWNAFVDKCKVPMPKLAADGVYGPKTKATVTSARFFLGYGQGLLHAGVDNGLIRSLRHPTRLGHRAMTRGRQRRRALRRRHAKPKGNYHASSGPTGWAGSRAVNDETLGVAAAYPAPITSTKRHTVLNGNLASDHNWFNVTAYADDFGTFDGERLAKELAKKLGIKGYTIGNYTSYYIARDGIQFRIQILWAVEGHYNHVHLGCRRVG